MGSVVKPFFAAALCALLLISCSGDSVRYHKLIYEASSDPAVNMDISIKYPGLDVLYETSGSSFRQDCGFVPENFEAEIHAEVIAETAEIYENPEVTVKIYWDDVCVAEETRRNSAQAIYSENKPTE